MQIRLMVLSLYIRLWFGVTPLPSVFQGVDELAGEGVVGLLGGEARDDLGEGALLLLAADVLKDHRAGGQLLDVDRHLFVLETGEPM